MVRVKINALSRICLVFSYVLEQVQDVTLSEKNYLCNCKSEICNVCNTVEDHCLQVMKNVHHHANGCFDWLLISEHWGVNPSREAIFIVSGKYKRFMFVHPVVRGVLDMTGNPPKVCFKTFVIWIIKLLTSRIFKVEA